MGRTVGVRKRVCVWPECRLEGLPLRPVMWAFVVSQTRLLGKGL